MKECSAYGQIDQGGGDKEGAHIYEHTQWRFTVVYSYIHKEMISLHSHEHYCWLYDDADCLLEDSGCDCKAIWTMHMQHSLKLPYTISLRITTVSSAGLQPG